MTAVDSPEKILFASTTQAFLQKEVPLSRVRELHAQGVSFERAWWRRAAELGWTALLVPEELGGGSVSGDGVADLAMVAEQLGKTVAPGPLYPVSTVLAGLVDCAEPRSHAATLESLVAGETVASWAVYEPGQGWAPHEPAVTARSEEHTSELQSRQYLVCRLLLEKKNKPQTEHLVILGPDSTHA